MNLKPVILGHRSEASFSETARAIVSAPPALGTPDLVAVRSILVQPGGKPWTHLRTVLRVGEGEDLPDHDVINRDLGPVRLLGMRLTTADFVQPADLTAFLTFWCTLIQTPARTFRDQTNVHWRPSRSQWSDRPCWRIEISDEAGTTGWANDPPGPFFKPEELFAVDIAAAVRQWLREPARRHDGVSQNSYSVIIPDYRACLRDLQMDGTELRVTVDARRADQLFCATEAEGLDGQAFTPGPVLVKDGSALVRFPRALRSLEVYLFDSEGNRLDEYSETANFSPWGRSVLVPGRLPGDAAHQSLGQARELGEGQQVEFKEWVPLTRSDPKSLELFKTVVAFANAEGGAIYIGVSDDAAVVGVARHLPKALDQAPGTSAEKLRDLYVTRLRRLIAEGVLPQITPDVAWIEDVGHWVLRVSVGCGGDRPYYLAENNQFYVRRGATNRRMTRDEFQRAFVRSPQAPR